MGKSTIVVLTGAGISAESGLKTFRDANGLWEGHDIMEVASPQGWASNMELVLDFYNQRRRQLKEVKPNAAHFALAELEKDFQVIILTQNVDNLHEAAGSSSVVHLHGELLKVRSTAKASLVYDWHEDLHAGQLCPLGSQLRPHIVWFGEEVPEMERAAFYAEQADLFLIVGTSLQVYPAAGLSQYVRPEAPIYYVDPKPAGYLAASGKVEVIAQTATMGIPRLVAQWRTQGLPL